MTDAQAPAFTMPSARWLRAPGITGEATIRLAMDSLDEFNRRIASLARAPKS